MFMYMHLGYLMGRLSTDQTCFFFKLVINFESNLISKIDLRNPNLVPPL